MTCLMRKFAVALKRKRHTKQEIQVGLVKIIPCPSKGSGRVVSMSIEQRPSFGKALRGKL